MNWLAELALICILTQHPLIAYLSLRQLQLNGLSANGLGRVHGDTRAAEKYETPPDAALNRLVFSFAAEGLI